MINKIPIKVIINKALPLNSKIGDILINKYIPAVTSVAACNKALTGVGASILDNWHVIK